MLIGYARVCTGEQDSAAQVAALTAAGCELIFREKACGRWDRAHTGSQCLVGGAEEIRNAGPICVFCSWEIVRNPLIFGSAVPMNRVGENSSVRFFNGHVENLLRHELSLSIGGAKRTGVSNLLCSSKEALRTSGFYTE
jgi:hypothetical protein